MTVTKPIPTKGGWLKLDVNVGGFEIKGCTWHPATGRLRFPRRRKNPDSKTWITVVRAPKGFIKTLKALLQSGQLETKRDRSPRVFRIFGLRRVADFWFVFGFEVRGVQILWCRWNPERGSIQFPITYLPGTGDKRFSEISPNIKRVVHAKGPHVLRLREALEKYAVKNGVIPKELLAAFQKEIQERKKQKHLAKAA
jgi:hypothetical protein